MITFNNIDENFSFLIFEVKKQVDACCRYLGNLDAGLYNNIVSRDDYIDNLKNLIENQSFSNVIKAEVSTQKEINTIRAKHIICVNLERIGDYCVNIVRQTGHFRSQNCWENIDYKIYFDVVKKCFPLILPVLEKGGLTDALTICHSEEELDRMYKNSFDIIMSKMHSGKSIEDQITILFILRYLERIGDSMLNIGEALLFAILGEKIKITQFEVLQKTLDKSGHSVSPSKIESFWGSRSGCQISKVSDFDTKKSKGHASIFKGGPPKKIREEMEALQKWRNMFENLVPKVFSHYEENDNAALLIEFLPGSTFDEIALASENNIANTALVILGDTICRVWRHTHKPGPIKTNYMKQLLARYDQAKQVHLDLFKRPKMLGKAKILSLEELIEQACSIEEKIPAPFSVFIHGDFNASNIVFNPQKNDIHFIDLHRSCDADYIQDISVLLVSFLRMPITGKALRRRLNWIVQQLYSIVEVFSKKHNDSLFHSRLTLALARSFVTSSRFELNKYFANEMVLRGQYLLEKIIRHNGKPWDEFDFPVDILYY